MKLGLQRLGIPPREAIGYVEGVKAEIFKVAPFEFDMAALENESGGHMSCQDKLKSSYLVELR